MNQLIPKIQILDTTLREGEQSRGISLTLEQKVDLAKELDDFGVDYIELGHPKVCSEIAEAVSTIAGLKLKAETVGHARAQREDIDSVAKCGTPWIGIFAGINEFCLTYKYNCSRTAITARIVDAVQYAKSLGLKVRFTCEDATRTNEKELVELYQRVEQSGADRISIADTVGILVPRKAFELVGLVSSSIKVPIHLHFHNDFGLAVANALSGLEAGAKVVDVTIDGIGERSGITPLAELCASLSVLYKAPNPWKLEKLPLLSEKLKNYTGIDRRDKLPIVGKDAFTHKAGLHGAAVLKEPKCYEAITPELFSSKRQILINKFSGQQVIAQELSLLGISAEPKVINQILAVLKESPSLEFSNAYDFYQKFKYLLNGENPAYFPRPKIIHA